MKFYLKDFCIFISIAETLSLSKTASELGMSVSSVSKRLARLEDYLNTTLFERTTRGVKLSYLGEKAYAKAKKITYDFANFIEDVRDDEVSHFNILIKSPFKEIPFTQWLYRYNHKTPPLKLMLDFIDDNEYNPLGLQDIIITNTRSKWPHAIHRRLGGIRLVSVKSNKDSFDDMLFPKEVCMQSIIFFSRDKEEVPQIMNRKNNESFPLNKTIIMSDLDEILKLVISQGAIAVGLPLFSVTELIEKGDIREINTEWNLPDEQYYIVWRDRMHYKPNFEGVLNFIENEFKKTSNTS